MKIPLIVLLVYISSFLHIRSELLDQNDSIVCTGDTFYKERKNGQAVCQKCPTCDGGGIGWNESYVRQTNKNGFLDCFPCAACPTETYRKYLSSDSRCQACVLDCKKINRYSSINCGFDSEGHCGDCINGVPESSEANSRCTNIDLNTISSTAFDKSPQDDLEKNLLEKLGFYKSPEEPTTNEHSAIGVKIMVYIVAAAIFLSLLVAVILGRSGRNSRNNTLANDCESSQKLMSSHGSKLGEDNDIETDGDHKSRGELPESVTIGQLDAMVAGGSEPENEQDIKLPPYDRLLDKNDETLIVISRNISGEKRYEMFESYLKLDKATIEPEEEKWQKFGKINFPEYIHNVLKCWLNIAGEKATLKRICEALQMAGFKKALKMVLELAENKNPSAHVCVELPDESVKNGYDEDRSTIPKVIETCNDNENDSTEVYIPSGTDNEQT